MWDWICAKRREHGHALPYMGGFADASRGRGGGGLELVKARPPNTSYYQKAFSCLNFFWIVFLSILPHHSILCWALDFASLPLRSRSHDDDDVADPGIVCGTICSPCTCTCKTHKICKIRRIRRLRGGTGGGASRPGSAESTASRNLHALGACGGCPSRYISRLWIFLHHVPLPSSNFDTRAPMSCTSAPRNPLALAGFGKEGRGMRGRQGRPGRLW